MSLGSFLLFWTIFLGAVCVTLTQSVEHESALRFERAAKSKRATESKSGMVISSFSFPCIGGLRVKLKEEVFGKFFLFNKDEDEDEEESGGCSENIEVTISPSTQPTETPGTASQPGSIPNSVTQSPVKNSPQVGPTPIDPTPTGSTPPTSTPIYVTACPNADDAPLEVLPNAIYKIALSSLDFLCTLTYVRYKPDGEEFPIPMGRTYDGNEWEITSGPLMNSIKFDCDSTEEEQFCTITIPQKLDDDPSSKFMLTSFGLAEASTLKSQDIFARFLEQTTFGPTRAQIQPFKDLSMTSSFDLNDDIAQWTHEQMYTVPETSHRAYYRRLSDTRIRSTKAMGKSIHACAPNSRWHFYTFNIGENDVSTNTLTIEEVSLSSGDKAYALIIDGIVRTEVMSIELREEWNAPAVTLTPGSYTICGVAEYLGGPSCIWYGGHRRYFLNPAIQFFSSNNLPENVIDMGSFAVIDTDFVPVPGTMEGNFFHLNEINDPKCDFLNLETFPIYLKFDDAGERYAMFDPRLKLVENTLESPATDGGNSAYIHGSYCSSAYRTFLNAEQCIYTEEAACSNSKPVPPTELPLTDTNLLTLHDLTGAYPYVVTGLRIENLGSPCKRNVRSRFMKTGHDEASCPVTTFTDDTAETLSGLLSLPIHEADTDIRDVLYTNWRNDCSVAANADLSANPLYVFADNECWLCVHPDEQSVIDFTPWVSDHPGMAPAITNFAENDEYALVFPSHHEMWRWEDNKDKLPYLGRYKGGGAFRSFPSYYQLETVKEVFDLSSSFSASGVVVCGSPNEVTNDLSLGDTGLSFTTIDSGLSYHDSIRQKDRLWLDVIQHSDDQLRQRIAWALCQIFAISQEAVVENQLTEGYMYYYDIFVRHAFESYLDIMKEVSTSPLMALMLTYYRSQSTAYVLARQGIIQFADENFAREIMQLFSIGLVMLNMDGTPVLDENGNKILTYTNDHIMSYARAWTGYDFQGKRANLDRNYNTPNRVDPMKIIPEWRDVFPKLDLKGGFIGDSYPLCADLPSKHHMRKGATYRLLGRSPLLETQANLPYYWGGAAGPDPMRKKINLDTSSPLFAKLCNDPNGGTDCNFQSQLTLDENLDCYGEECGSDTLRVLEVGDGVYFEYIRQPCVELAYYNDPKTVTFSFRQKEMCGNPATEVAGVACCTDNHHDSRYQPCLYTNERVTFSTAEARCSDLGMDVCDWRYSNAWDNSPDCNYFNYRYMWHGAACLNQVKVGDNGMVAIVHAPQNMINGNLEQKVKRTSPNFFSIFWDNDAFPSTDNDCGNDVCEIVSDGCLCNTTVAETQVLSSAPSTKEEVMSSLFIGSVSPDSFDSGDYGDPVVNGDVKIYFHHLSGDSYDMMTIFEVEHLGKKYFYKNMKSEVFIVDDLNNETEYNFRNPPHFNNIQETDVRDAEHETQAVLESYFYHPNVAPFLAIHFIQRLGISNPSPRYIEEVATAFKSGVYEYEESTGSTITFGNSEYGNLGALVAAVVLDREARSLVLDFDSSKGSLREPLIKVTNMFRSMEYEGFEGNRHTRFDHSISEGVTTKIGQMAHDIKSVFSFFRREYSPNGPLGEAKLTAPEGQRYTTPTVLGTINGLFSLVKFGFSYCYSGFAPSKGGWCGHASEENDNYAWGRLFYAPEDTLTSEEIIDELATLLTGGRLNSESRRMIKEHYDSAANPGAALRLAQQLITVSPEFHSTSLMRFSGEARKPVDPPLPSDRPYKSVVFILLAGGIDSFNVIVPLSGCTETTSYEHYESVRGAVAISKSSLLPISTPGQPCSTFGVHPDLSLLRDLYNEGELSFYANVGVLFEEVTKQNWAHKTTTQLFAHNTQQRDSQTVDPFENVVGTGVLGRMADRLTALGYQTGSYSISGQNAILTGEPQKSPAQAFISQWGIEEFNGKPSTTDMESHMRDLNNITSSFSGKYGKTWASIFNSAMDEYGLLSETLADVETDMNFPNTWLGRQLRQASIIMKKRNELGNDRQFFYTDTGGWDTHSAQFTAHDTILPELNSALSTFVDEMKSQGLWDDTAVVIASDFGRTMSANSGEGTDHAWGGNYWVMGGDVKGGNMLGSFLDDMSDSSEWSIGRGRFIPTTSWDAIYNGVAEWMDISGESDLNKVLPNRNKFSTLFSRSDMFDN